MTDTRTLKIVISGNSTSGKQALKAIGDEAKTTSSNLGGVASTMAGFATKGAVALGAIGVAAGALGVKTASGMEQAKIAFTNMLGSGEKADAFLLDLEKFAAATPFEFPDLVRSSQQMMAMGFAAKDVKPTLIAVGDAVAAMGGSADNVQRVSRALGQMQAKGKVAGDELLQLTEQGIPAIRILADGYGVTTSQMSKMVTKGQVLSEKAIPMIVKGLEKGTKSVKGFGGMMDKQSQTMQGRWSTLVDTVQMGLGRLTMAVFPQMTKGIEVITVASDAFSKAILGTEKPMRKAGESAEAFASRAADANPKLTGFAKTAQDAGKKVVELGDWIKTSVVPWLMKLKDVVIAASEVIGPLLAVALKALIVVVLATGLAISKVTTFLSEHLGLVKVLTGAIIAYYIAQGIATVQTKVAAAAELVQYNLALLRNGGLKAYLVTTKLGIIVTGLWTAAQWLLNVALDANPIGLVVIAVAALVGAITLIATKTTWFQTVWEYMSGAIGTSWRWLWNSVLAPVIRFILNGFAKITDGIVFMLNALSHIPGFGWAKTAADKMAGAASKARELAKGIKDIPTSKTIAVTARFSSIAQNLTQALAHSVGAKAVIYAALGGPVPGSGRGDKVPAMLEPEEFIVRRDGSNLADALAFYGSRIKGYAFGGPVAMGDVANTPSSGRADYTNHLHVLASLSSFMSSFFSGSLVQLGHTLQKMGFQVGEHPLFGGVAPVHVKGSQHYRGNALDVNYDGRGQAFENSKINSIIGMVQRAGFHTLWQVAGHYDHLHIGGYDKGGMLPPGLSLAYNGTGRPEPVGSGGDIIVYVTVEGNVTAERDLAKSITLTLRDELKRHANRNGGRTGLPA